MRLPFMSVLICVLFMSFAALLPAQEAAKDQAPAAAKPSSGTFVIGNKTYKLEHVIAYEAKVDDEARITILASDRRLPMDQIKATLRKDDGSDLQLSLDQPYVRIAFNRSGVPIACSGSGNGKSFSGGGELTGELKLDAGRARGQVTMTRKDERLFKTNCELTFDVVVGAEPAKPARPAGPVKPTVSGTFNVDGKPVKLGFVSAHACEPFDDKAAVRVILSELDHSKETKPELRGRFQKHGIALIISFFEDGSSFGCDVVHPKKSFSSSGVLKTEAFDLGDGQISGHITTNGPDEFFDLTWEVDIKFIAALNEPLIQPKVAEKPSKKPRDKADDKPVVKLFRSKPETSETSAGLNVHDLPIPKDATDIDLKKLVEQIVFKSPADVKTMVDTFSKKLDEQKWSKTGADLVTPKSAILNRKNGNATLTIFVKPADKGSVVTIMSKGLSWEEKQPAAKEDDKTDDASAKVLTGENFPLPDKAKEVDRNADLKMITCRTTLSVKEVIEFYRKKLPAFGWKEDKENTLLLEDQEIGAMSLNQGDDKLTILIQPGKPTARTRIVVQGDDLVWDEKDDDGDADSSKPKAEKE